MTGEQCPKVDDKCTTCVGIARTAMSQLLEHNRPDVSSKTIRIIVENSMIEGPVQEQSSLDDLHCDERRERARKIGREMGEIYS